MLCCSSIGQLLIIQLIIWIQTTLLCCRRWCGHGTIRWMCSGCVLMWLQIEVDHLCHHCTPPGSVYSTAHGIREKTHFIRIYCITDLLKIRNTIFDSLLRMRQHTLPSAEEGDLKLWSWPPPVSDRRPWYLAAAHCCYYLLPHRNTQSPANDRFGNFSERSQVGHGCCHVTC